MHQLGKLSLTLVVVITLMSHFTRKKMQVDAPIREAVPSLIYYYLISIPSCQLLASDSYSRLYKFIKSEAYQRRNFLLSCALSIEGSLDTLANACSDSGKENVPNTMRLPIAVKNAVASSSVFPFRAFSLFTCYCRHPRHQSRLPIPISKSAIISSHTRLE